MAELTAKAKTSVITLVLIFIGLMLGFHYETVIGGLFPEYSVEPYESQKQCKPVPLNDYVGSSLK